MTAQPASAEPHRRVSRRSVMSGAALSAAALPLAANAGGISAAPPAPARNPRAAANFDLEVNGRRHRLSIDTRTTLLDALREHLALTGSKKGCDHGQCGACTVLVGGRRVLACLTLAVSVREPVTTIEGLADPGGEALHPMQQAFIDHDAFQCGYCTPGQIMSAIACVHEGHARTDHEIREYMSGNLCRCAAYPHIVDAINDARTKMTGAAHMLAVAPAARSTVKA